MFVRWALDAQPDIVLPARSTPWPEVVLNSTSPSTSRQTKHSSLDTNKLRARDGKSNPSERRLDANQKNSARN